MIDFQMQYIKGKDNVVESNLGYADLGPTATTCRVLVGILMNSTTINR